MRTQLWLAISLSLGLAACATMKAPQTGAPVAGHPPVATSPLITGPASFEFEDTAIGAPPQGWLAATTNGGGAVGTWEVMQGPQVPSRTHVVGLVSPNHETPEAFNVLWTDRVSFLNGRITVDVLPRSGERDQGGGPMWRVKDADNYYVCRWNPLEKNFRLYVVVNGQRRQLASANTDLPAGQWHRIVVTQTGEYIRCTLGGQTTIEATDNSLPDGGGVGLWTKADALTAFDGLIVSPE
jgi:hypothetical protein